MKKRLLLVVICICIICTPLVGCLEYTETLWSDEGVGISYTGFSDIMNKEELESDSEKELKALFSDSFIPFNIVFPYETQSEYGVYLSGRNHRYEYLTRTGMVGNYMIHPFSFTKDKAGSTFLRSVLPNLKYCKYTETDGITNSIPYLKRIYEAPCPEINDNMHKYHALYLICGDIVYTVTVHPMYLESFDIFSDEYIERITLYIKENIAPLSDSFKEYEPGTSFTEIYRKAM